VQEYLHKRIMTLEFHVTRLAPYSLIEYEIPPMVKGAFTISGTSASVLLKAEIRFGTDAPVIENLVDNMLRAFIGRRLRALKQHMVEEGRNLKSILEEDARSETIRAHSV
jgi:hypothetical protein